MATTIAKTYRTRNSYLNATTVVTVLALSMFCVVMAFPFVWTVSASFKEAKSVFLMPPNLWPSEWHVANYTTLFSLPNIPFLLFFWNSFKIATLITVGQLITCTMAAYAFARLRFPGKHLLFIILLTGLMVPIQLTVVPIFIEMKSLHLVDHHAALVLPSITSIFGVFLLRQFFLAVPNDLEDAARIDGAGPLRLLWQIMVPLVSPALTTLAIITFTGSWNEFFRPLIFLDTWSNYTWPQGVKMLTGTQGVVNVAVVMAAVTVGVLPVFVAFTLANRRIVESISLASGLK